MKINMGAGNRRLPGYTGIDAVPRPGADIVAPANQVPLPDGCATEVLAVHLVEHLLPWNVPAVLAEWHRLLASGGLLALELPDLLKCCRNILEGKARPGKHPDQLGMWGLFGDATLNDEWMLHRWAYTFTTLAPIVKAAGFVKVVEAETQFHPAGRGVRDFRLEARKP
jgi:predicted SAM-dependent methyltransferase